MKHYGNNTPTTSIVTCANCGTQVDLAIHVRSDLVYREDILEALGWLTVNDRHYCPNCVHPPAH